LLLQANSYQQLREGVVCSGMQLISRVESQQVHFYVMAAFGWAAGTEAIGMILIEQAGCLNPFRNGEFQTKVRDLGFDCGNRVRLRSPRLSAPFTVRT
jgi:hypothetical protein